nr:unnamed protein product [Digitaria exilis]
MAARSTEARRVLSTATAAAAARAARSRGRRDGVERRRGVAGGAEWRSSWTWIGGDVSRRLLGQPEGRRVLSTVTAAAAWSLGRRRGLEGVATAAWRGGASRRRCGEVELVDKDREEADATSDAE